MPLKGIPHTRHAGVFRGRAFSAVTVPAALLALTALPPGAAHAGERTATGDGGAAAAVQPAHPEDDYAGSQIRRHEGGQRGTVVPTAAGGTEGVDVSSFQGDVDWKALRRSGVRFAYVKATEATSYTSPSFTSQYNGSYRAGVIRGAYHFATPDTSDGATQARYFLAHGGGWSKDGKTLPGALDMEYNPYGETCYGLSADEMVEWIRDFSDTYRERTGRDVVIYTSANWWQSCTDDDPGFADTNPLWIPRYGSSVGALPAGWKRHTIWQYTSQGPTVGDHNRFNGGLKDVRALANG
ncbi:lysozyme [Streptomyces sp. NPDC059740]|uniref:lysozyme n=1 Tax=Streptomyces sp. NPDC059740 TaxID=3346926 RepID=UPI003665427E